MMDTGRAAGGPPPFPGGGRFRSFGAHLRETFGRPVFKVTVDAGFTCPNRDGTLGRGGCVYCENTAFSPAARRPPAPVREQVEAGVARRRRRHPEALFLAYFQPYSNTYAPLSRLRQVFEEALACPGVAGLAIGTRPDCLPPEVLDYLAELSRRTYLWLELGLQSARDRTLRAIGRGHLLADFEEAVGRCRAAAIRVCAHVILGLPGEGPEDMHFTAQALTRLGMEGVKIHDLQVVRGSRLEDLHQRGEVRLLERAEYVAAACDFLERLSPATVIHRLQAETPGDLLLAPAWALKKPRVRQAIEAELERRGSWQGSRYTPLPAV